MTFLANPPPLKIPPPLRKDPETMRFIQDLVQSIYLIWVRTGAGTGLTPVEAGGTNAASVSEYLVSLGFTDPILDKKSPGDIGGTTAGSITTDDFISITANNIKVGTMDNVVIGNTTAVAGSFTSINISASFTHTGSSVGFYNTTPITQGAALTATSTSITHTSPGAADYAIQDLTNTTPFGFVSKDEGNTVLSVILNLQTRVNELEARLNASTGIGVIA